MEWNTLDSDNDGVITHRMHRNERMIYVCMYVCVWVEARL